MKELAINTQGAHHIHSGMLNTKTTFEMMPQLWGLQSQPNTMLHSKFCEYKRAMMLNKQQVNLTYSTRIKLPFSKYTQT